MRKIISTLLILAAFALSFVSCGGDNSGKNDGGEVVSAENKQNEDSGGDKNVYNRAASIMPLSNGSETFVFVDGEMLPTKLVGRLYDTETNLNDNIKLVTTKVDGARIYYMVNGKEAKKITSDTINEISMNAEGGKAAYTTDEHVLYLYDDKGSIMIDTNVGSFVISPNGNAILYSKSEKYDPEYEYSIDEESPDVDLYMYDGKKSTQLDKNKDSLPVAISDDCMYMYIVRIGDSGNENLYIINKKGEVNKLCTDFEVGIFNRDHSQILFNDYDENESYISVKGKERTRLSGYVGGIVTKCTFNSRTLSLKDLKGMVYASNDGGYFDPLSSVYRITKEYESEKLKSDITYLSISDDGKTLFYTKSNGSSYSLYSEKIGSDTPVLLSEGIDDSYYSSIMVTRDGKYVYFIEEDDMLYVVQSNGEGKKRICDAEVGIKGILPNGTVFFAVDQTSDGAYTLYSVTGKKDKVKIADDVYSFGVTGNKAYYITDKTNLENGDTGYTYYFSKDGKTFTEIMSNAVS